MKTKTGTTKFIVYVYNGANVRKKEIARPDHFVFNQWGRVWLKEDGKTVLDKPFTNFGEMLAIMSRVMRKRVMDNLKESGTW